MNDTLYVHYRGQTIGELKQSESRSIQFRYHPQWSQSPLAFPISLSLPLDHSFTDSASHNFFANLLPEANVRQQICKSLGISLGNDFQLLKSIGGDCAGALAITTQPEPGPVQSAPRYEIVTEEQLADWSVGTPDAFSAVTGQNEVRLSLAGAQDKLPVHFDGNQIWIPLDHTPSTHILKFASPFYSHLPENETFMSLLANVVGLPVVKVRLLTTFKARVAVITRYDRREEAGQYHRLHQEDFCQALGINPANKYEKEGGPSLRQCAEIIRRHTSFPLVELQKLMQWSLFNLVVGNADAHGKNLSLLYAADGSLGLAPFYDLVCTRNYKGISRELAMNLGGIADPDLVGKAHLQRLAEDLKMNPNLVLKTAKSLLEQVSAALSNTVELFGQNFGDSPVLERLPIIIRKQIRRLKNQLG